jgi:hypothetical protein
MAPVAVYAMVVWPVMIVVLALAVTADRSGSEGCPGSTAYPTPGPDSQDRHLLPPRWWERASGILRVGFRRHREPGQEFSLDPARLPGALQAVRGAGFDAIEIFAPALGGRSYGGLDTIDHYRLDPRLGTMEDFRRLVRVAHQHGLAVTTFDNLGYTAVEEPGFFKACDDVRAGRSSRETSFFIWSDSADAPPPGKATRDSFFLTDGTWQYSERAGKCYWSKWPGQDANGEEVRLPQHNWASAEFQQEAEKVVRFWMDTGIDGMIIDAVNWYVGITWEVCRQRMTDVITSYGNAYCQPEGGGGFHEDPSAWISEGEWNSVQDYGLGIWWEEGSDVVRQAVETGDPRCLEPALRDYHDRVVAAGGSLYHFPPDFDDPKRQALSVAVVACAGDVVAGHYPSSLAWGREVRWLLEAKRLHPALQQLSARRHLPAQADDKYYAFLRTAADKSERILVVFNFQPEEQQVVVNLSGVATGGLVDLRSGGALERQTWLEVALPAFGFSLYQVLPSQTVSRSRHNAR